MNGKKYVINGNAHYGGICTGLFSVYWEYATISDDFVIWSLATNGIVRAPLVRLLYYRNGNGDVTYKKA